jgi:excisionase family DNA binding protein
MDNHLSLDQAILLIPKILEQQLELSQTLQTLIQQRAVPSLLTEKEAASILGIASSTLRKWVCQKQITAVKVGGNKFRPDDLLQFIQKNTIKGFRN